MGYKTYYKLTIEQGTGDLATVKRRIDEIAQEENPFDDWCKWYDHDGDMLAVSKLFPALVLCLEGKGEENGDYWRTYYHNGKKQECRARIIYDPYEPTKLQYSS